MNRLAGKAAVVTGAGTGLGRSTACLYAAEGAKVAVADIRPDDGRRTVELIEKAGGDAIFVQTDVTKSNEVEALVAAAEEAFGAVHIMTANAGILGSGKPLAETSEEEFFAVMGVNFNGVVHAFKYAIPAIERAGGGAMTATGSVTSNRGHARADAYCSSKHAILGLVRSLAVDLWPSIRVNLASPGAMSTEIGQHATELHGSERRTLERDPMRGGNPPVVADPLAAAYVHLFLVSDEGKFVNGQSIVADYGWTTGLPKF